MKKKYYMILLTSLSTAIFSGCGAVKNQIAENPLPATVTDQVIPSDNMPVTDQVIPSDNTPVTDLTDLTDQTTTAGICIDYDIKSYASIQNFSYELFAQNLVSENPVLSPVSAYLALSMAGFGADGTTRNEFYDLLGEDMMVLSDDMMNRLPKNSENITISLANSAWLDNQLAVNDQWLGEITSFMDAQAFQSNLSSTETMDSINHWIEEQTNGLIDEMLTEPLDVQTKLALFNTVYFKAKWQTPFEAYSTYEEDFTLKSGETIKTEMMHNSFKMDYLTNDFVEGVILPYRNWQEEDGGFAFIALKPKSSDLSIRDVYGKLTAETVVSLLDSKQTRLVNLKLPKFETTFDLVLNDSLKNMGLKEAFDANLANFALLGTTENRYNLFINLVRQKAKIIVDEEGTEAAAATEVLMDECAAVVEIEELDVFFNEPFFYMIMDMDKEIPLFFGILDNPAVDC